MSPHLFGLAKWPAFLNFRHTDRSIVCCHTHEPVIPVCRERGRYRVVCCLLLPVIIGPRIGPRGKVSALVGSACGLHNDNTHLLVLHGVGGHQTENIITKKKKTEKKNAIGIDDIDTVQRNLLV